MSQSQVIIGLVNPKGPSNVGTIMRAAGCFNAHEVLYTGTRYARAAQYEVKTNTDTHKSRNNIPLTQVECLFSKKAEGMEVVCVELCLGATSLTEFSHPERALYIFGPEDGSISQTIIDQADHVVYVPTIDCLNLAATTNVVLYDRLAKSSEINKGDELIKSSRDTNNRLKVST
ncbi:RNA methyltransferase [Thalassotalea sp. PP2-459]|uniref:RNA methyltransferase n=1 Tax=Thalassotalea sp. PP2-459 TaxID=1742724 RepID=UPI00094599C9|nr:RNA methyltransferase [Thalassotalea sp. PP2-459]OKY27474.1 23S rRNA methyltransferase [Thalassotalea sp. PP2-459]